MAEQSAEQPKEQSLEKMDTTLPTVYNEWRIADGLFRPESASKIISFTNGFVRVRKQDWTTISDEGWAGSIEKSFKVPSWYYCEVLDSAQIKFSKD